MSELFQRLRASVTVKLLFIGFLVLILLIPMDMVRGVIYERNHQTRKLRTISHRIAATSPPITACRSRTSTTGMQ